MVSLVTFAITLSLLQFCSCLWVEVLHGLMCLLHIKGMINGAPLTGRVFKIRPIFPRYFMSNKWHFTCQPYPVRGEIRQPGMRARGDLLERGETCSPRSHAWLKRITISNYARLQVCDWAQANSRFHRMGMSLGIIHNMFMQDYVHQTRQS